MLSPWPSALATPYLYSDTFAATGHHNCPILYSHVNILKILVTNPGHSPSVRNGVQALFEQEMLYRFATTYVDHPGDPLSSTIKRVIRLVKPSYVSELERRAFHDIPFQKIRTCPTWELLRTASDKLVGNPTLTDRIWELRDFRFDNWASHQVTPSIDAVHVNKFAALKTILTARRHGVLTFYRQPTQHHEFFTQIYRQQAAMYPEAIRGNDVYPAPKLRARRNERRDQELAETDYILVKSTFAKRTLMDAGIDDTKILVTPYGFPEVDSRSQTEPARVTFLNAGTQSLRKGLHLLYRAWQQLAPRPETAALRLVGRMTLPDRLYRELAGDVKWRDSIPHTELMQQYKEASVFVLPSLADAFGMVVTEAMSRGLPVIVTENTGAADLITHEKDGFVIPANDVGALVAQMQWCMAHKHRLPEIGARAIDTARSWQWKDYRRELAETMRHKIEKHRRRKGT